MPTTVPSGGTPPPGPSGKTIIVLIVLTTLLMAFSVIFWLLGNETMAGTAGLVAIGLIGDICRRLLGGTDRPAAPAYGMNAAAGLGPGVSSVVENAAVDDTPDSSVDEQGA